MEAAALRAAAGAAAPAEKAYRWWRPKSDWASLAGIADGLAAAVDRAEEKVQQELRGGPGLFMPVRFTPAAAPLDGQLTGPAGIDQIAGYFAGLEHPRRLVVLGDPGAGKTVAATYLVRGLLARRSEILAVTRRAAEPVPVRISAAGWDGGQEFSGWLANRLGLDYQLRSNVAKKMVHDGKILPVLDGLDEMDDDTTDGTRARALLDRLNRNEWAHRPVVVLCRSTEFEHLKQVGNDNGLHGAATVVLDSLPTDQVAVYLTRYQRNIGATHPAWDQVVTHLREHTDTGSPLAETLRNPWMLGLTATTLHHTPQATTTLLASSTAEEVRDRLFAAQIPAAIAATDDIERFHDYTPDNVGKWLRTLARHLEHRRDTGRNGTAIRLDEIWEIAGTNRILLLHTLTLTLTIGLTFGLAVGLTEGLMFGLAVGLAVGLTLGLTVGLTFGLMFGLWGFSRAKRIAWKVPGRSRWRRGLVGGLTTGLATGLATGLTLGLATGLTLGLAGGLGIGLTEGLETTTEDQLAMGTDERRLIRYDWQAALFSGLTTVLTTWLAFGLTAGVTVRLMVWLAAGLTLGLTLGLVLGYTSVRFLLAVLVFRFTADFPDHPAVFLAWARNSGLLRVNATAYQFRHQTYQQWLLHHPDTTAPAPSASSTSEVT